MISVLKPVSFLISKEASELPADKQKYAAR